MNRIILICLFFIGLTCYTHAQTLSQAQVLIPPGIEFSKEQEHELEFKVFGIDGTFQNLKMVITDVTTVAGVNYFNIVTPDQGSDGYCELRFSVSSKNDFSRMLKEIFCKLKLNSFKVNETVFANCELVTIP